MMLKRRHALAKYLGRNRGHLSGRHDMGTTADLEGWIEFLKRLSELRGRNQRHDQSRRETRQEIGLYIQQVRNAISGMPIRIAVNVETRHF